MGKYITYSDNELLDYLKRYYIENGRIPTTRDFTNNPEYPGTSIYYKRFGNWNNALTSTGLDIDNMVKQGVLQDTNRKGRLFEIIVRDHFENKSTDLSKKHDNPVTESAQKEKVMTQKVLNYIY